MVASRIHLVRHGEVENPHGILYGRLSGYPLSTRGQAMASATALWFAESGRRIGLVASSPLQRAVESAAPIAQVAGLPVEQRVGLIEAASKLEGGNFDVSLKILFKPRAWRYLVNPLRPSWGEPFREVADRMRAELEWAYTATAEGDAVLVSHQLPIWITHRWATGRPLAHDPRKRRCSLSSVTSFAWENGRFVEIGYEEPARPYLSGSIDRGAV